MSLRIRFQYPTGSTLAYSIERLSDGLLYDSADGTFKATPTTPTTPIPEDSGIFLGRYKATLTPTPTAQFTDGNYAVTIHDAKNGNLVVAELAARMVSGDDTDGATLILSQLAGAAQAFTALADAVNAPRPFYVGSPILPAH